MTLSVSISDEAKTKLEAKAARAGVDLATFAGRELERLAAQPSLDEVLAPVREQFEASGMTEDELTELLETAKHEMRAEHRARRAS